MLFFGGKSVADPDLGSRIGKKSGSGSGMNNPDHISESQKTIFWVKYLNSLVWIRDGKKIGSGIRDGEKSDPGSGINIPDPQH